MLTRPPSTASTQRPAPQRSVSHGPNVEIRNAQSYGANTAISRLSNVRSLTGPYPGEQLVGNAAQRRNVSMVELPIEVDVDFEEPRPKKRARFEADVDLVGSPQGLTPQQDALHETIPGEALGWPMRPVEPLRRQGLRRKTGEDAARRAEGLTPPAMATKLPLPKGVADFSPWHGQHPEDILNEQAIKNGYSEKGPSPNQNESNTARLTIWPSLSQKNNLALHTLSLLYTQVLEKRQTSGRCTAPSNFKPPPRVTVTDTKREAWLKDLANPNVPLRRQSRTIPHGIRGKLLLEQCVAKAVPLQRAVWLAKCVGANELRAFRRKGVSGAAAAQGEAKWVRDWTVAVEQFLSDTIIASGQQGWRARIEYAVKLVTTIYTENLLEKDHFLDWTVSSLSAASLENAPSWMLLTQLYWRDIVSFARRGRLLAKALLAHLDSVSTSDYTAYHSLKEHLRKQLVGMLSKAQECLVLPDVWRTYRHIIKSIADADAQLETSFHDVGQRNQRLLETTTKPLTHFCHPMVRLYHMLEKVSLEINLEELAQQCIKIMPDTTELVTSLLSWATTRYISDHSRIVLVEQLIDIFHNAGLETDNAVLAFLAKSYASSTVDADKTCLLIANLVRHANFSPGRYLKWLITSGATSGGGYTDLAKGLLLRLPSAYLPQHLSNTRASLLSRLHDIDFCSVQFGMKDMQQALEEALEESSKALVFETLLLQQSQILKTDFADWATRKLAKMSKENSMTLHIFCVYRSIFECCSLFDGIVLLVEAALTTDDFLLLASVSDTINMHAVEFAAMSKLMPCLEGLVERYRMLRTQQPLEKTCIIAMKNLFSRVDDRAACVKVLKNDLIIYERQNISAVCSPASDNIVGMHAGSIETDDEMEAVFASGNTMDQSLMQRVFLRIMQRAEKPTRATTNPSAPCRWLTHIRLLDQTTFENIVTKYLRTILHNPSQATLPRGVCMLIAADCYDITRLVSCIPDNSSTRSSSAVLKFLACSLDDDLGVSDSEHYHLRQQRFQFCHEDPEKVRDLLANASTILDDEPDAAWIMNLVPALNSTTLESAPVSLRAVSERILVKLDPSLFSGQLTASLVVSGANALNAPFCAAWISSCEVEAQSTRTALLDAVMSGSPVWPILLKACPVSVIRELYAGALEHLLREDDNIPGEKYIALLDVTHALLKQNHDQTLFTTIAARLKATAKVMSSSNESRMMEVTLEQIKTLLHITALCTSTSREADGHTQGRAYIVMALCSILSLPSIDNDTDLAEYITDVAGTLIDRLPGEVVTHLSRSVQNAGLKQSTIASCFGNAGQPDSWLALASAAQPTTSLQTRALLKVGSSGPSLQTATRNAQFTGMQQQQMARMSMGRASQQNVDLKYIPYPVRRWEVMPDPTPVIGENDSSISLILFGARKV